MCLDTFSYLLGKKTGGGGEDLSEYFVNGDISYSAGGCIKKLPFEFDCANLTNIGSFFEFWKNLETITLKNAGDVTTVARTFNGCIKLMFADVRDILFSNITNIGNYNSMFGSGVNRVPNDCLIIVKDDTEKTSFIEKFGERNVKTVAEYEVQQ